VETLACRLAWMVGSAVVTTVASRPIMNPAIDPTSSVTRWRGAGIVAERCAPSGRAVPS
jgi:hypothetical protein